MNWFDWLLVVYLSANALITIAFIGRDREPTSPSVAVVVTIVMALLIAGIIIYNS